MACGTVFNEVLLWKVSDIDSSQDKVLVRTRLRGHDGVIFSIRYNQERQLLCSVSDDRSIKVWKAVFTNNCCDVAVSCEVAEQRKIRSLYYIKLQQVYNFFTVHEGCS